jgi:hypothetical protein
MHLDHAGPGMTDLNRVNDGLDQPIVMNPAGKNSVAREFKSLLQVADRSNMELKWHVFM